MKRAHLAASALVFLGACSRRETVAPIDGAVPPDAAALPAAQGPLDAGPSTVDSGAPACTPSPAPKSATSIGHTSVVFKLLLPDGKKAAWKPDADKRRGRYRGEIGSYRLGVALGLAENVPPACAQSFTMANLTQAFLGDSKGMNQLLDEVVNDGPNVHGALIPWIDGLQLWTLEKEPVRTQTRGWLRGGTTIPEDKVDLARQLADLVLLDYLTTNWDRYSGGNVGLDRTGKTVLFIDNDAAFMTAPPKSSAAHSRALLQDTDRFSRGSVAHLEALDEAALGIALGDENGHPLFPAEVVHALELRREELVRIIAAKRRIHGDDATLFFR